MSSETDEIIKGHEYDGIRELDNPLPRWWLLTFYASIVFAIGYFTYYEIMDTPSMSEQLQAKMEQIREKRQEANADGPKISAEDINLASLVKDPQVMETGKKHFEAMCASCHGQNGQGIIGPNLTDNYWIHSKGKAEGLLYAIRNGFPEKGMPPWANLIPEEDHGKLAAYVYSMQGTNLEGGKEPQGELVE